MNWQEGQEERRRYAGSNHQLDLYRCDLYTDRIRGMEVVIKGGQIRETFIHQRHDNRNRMSDGIYRIFEYCI